MPLFFHFLTDVGISNSVQLFAEIAPGFKKYPEGSFQFIVGTASSLDPATKSVSITTSTSDVKQEYDILILATGSRYIGEQPWKSSPTGYEATKELLHKVQEQVKAAKSIVVGGAGPTGVETVGELGFEYGKNKEITLITSGDELLIGSLPIHVAKVAENELVKLHVKIVKSTTVSEANTTAEGKTELILSNGEKKVVDLYLPTIGVIPNSEYVPKALLDEKGAVVVDSYLRVKNAENIWAAGDIIDIEASQLVNTQKQAAALAKSLDLVLKGKQPVAYKYGGSPMLAVTLGRSKATGANGNTKVPGIIIWWFKGRTLGTQDLNPYVTGSKF